MAANVSHTDQLGTEQCPTLRPETATSHIIILIVSTKFLIKFTKDYANRKVYDINFNYHKDFIEKFVLYT